MHVHRVLGTGALQVDRYIYFPACAEKFRRLGGSLLERGADEDPSSGLQVSTRVRDNAWVPTQNPRPFAVP